MPRRKIVIASMMHETNTFSAVPPRSAGTWTKPPALTFFDVPPQSKSTSPEQVVADVLINHIDDHFGSIRKAVGR